MGMGTTNPGGKGPFVVGGSPSFVEVLRLVKSSLALEKVSTVHLCDSLDEKLSDVDGSMG